MNIKEQGQVFTPYYIVKYMLGQIGYDNKKIINKKIMEPATGDGAFINEIIRILINVCKKEKFSNEKILNIILNNVYGYELNKISYENLISNVIEILKEKLNVTDIIKITDLNSKLRNNFLNEDTLLAKNNKKYDLIIGNPPYVRIHNLNKVNLEKYRKDYKSMKKGNVNLYFAFYEWAINHLSTKGVGCFITPNTFLRNESGKELRQILKNKLSHVHDFGSQQIFPNISTYNSIIVFQNKYTSKCVFEINRIKDNEIEKKQNIIYKPYFIKDKIYIGTDANDLKKILNSVPKNVVHFQNGIATLSDKIFITNNFKKIDEKYFLFNNFKIEAALLKDIVKISTFWSKFDKKKIIFPYKRVNNKIIQLSEKELAKKFPYGYKYLLTFKADLVARALDKNCLWFHYGRSQALSSILHEKVVIRVFVKNELKYDYIHKYIEKETLVYSGLYSKIENKDREIINELLTSDNLLEFMKLTGFDKQGNYKTVTSTILKEYFND